MRIQYTGNTQDAERTAHRPTLHDTYTLREAAGAAAAREPPCPTIRTGHGHPELCDMLHPGKRAAAAAFASNALSAELDSHGTADAYWPSRRRRQRSRRLSWSSRNTPGYTLSESAGSNLAAVARAAVDGAASERVVAAKAVWRRRVSSSVRVGSGGGSVGGVIFGGDDSSAGGSGVGVGSGRRVGRHGTERTKPPCEQRCGAASARLDMRGSALGTLARVSCGSDTPG